MYLHSLRPILFSIKKNLIKKIKIWKIFFNYLSTTEIQTIRKREIESTITYHSKIS